MTDYNTDYASLQLRYYQANGATSNCLQDAEREFLIAQGLDPEHNQDMWFALLRALGYSGSLPDMLSDFWCDGEGKVGPAPIPPPEVNLLTGESSSVDPNWTKNPDDTWTSDGTDPGITSVAWATSEILDGMIVEVNGRVISISAGYIFYYLEAGGVPVVISEAGAFSDTQTGPYPPGQQTLIIAASADFVGTIILDTAYNTLA